MDSEDFSLLEEVVKECTKAKFKFGEFFKKMEKAFTELGFREQIIGGVDNILILRTHGEISNFFEVIPAIREIRRNFPFACIDLVVDERMYPLAECCPYVNKVIDAEELKTCFKGKKAPEAISSVVDFAKKHFWSRRYSLVFDFRITPSTPGDITAYMSGAKERVGYVRGLYNLYEEEFEPEYKNPSDGYLTHPALLPKSIIHEVEKYLYLLKVYGLQIHSRNMELWYNYSELYQAKEILKDFAPDKLKIAVGIDAFKGENKYPTGKYLQALEKIADSGAAVVVFGREKVSEGAALLQENLSEGSVLNLVEMQLEPRVEAAIISQCDMYIGNLSGIYNIAVACRLPVVAVSCEAKNRSAKFNFISNYHRQFPWQTLSVVVRPKVAKDVCSEIAKEWVSSSCNNNGSTHCITQIKPDEIVVAYEKLRKLADSVQKTKAPMKFFIM